MQRNFHNRNWACDYFYADGSKYRRDRTHKSAWCKGCLKSRSVALKDEDERLVLYGQIEEIRSEEEHDLQVHTFSSANYFTALNEVPPICGKIATLHTHLARCPHADQKARHQASLDKAVPRRGQKSAALPDGAPNPSASLGGSAASAGWSWNSVMDPEFVSMMKILRPDLKIPDRRVLSGRVLDAEIDRVVGNLKSEVEGKLATGMCDRWKN
ncbi:hypothetical protein BDV93DRAFT_514145 [Ceratobasidium sp. AG-I]|nr:hypothetical protein BDV93DRAFT_514145 [Ceratobasidium sp. AG-I]